MVATKRLSSVTTPCYASGKYPTMGDAAQVEPNQASSGYKGTYPERSWRVTEAYAGQRDMTQ